MEPQQNNEQQVPEWQRRVRGVALKFAMETELRFSQALQAGQGALPLPTTPSEESMRFLVDQFYQVLIGATVLLVAKTIGDGLDVEENFVTIARARFKALRFVMEQERQKNGSGKIIIP